jgi:hypothetical protein
MLPRHLHVLVAAAAVCLASCKSVPDSYAPPIQRKPLTAPLPLPYGHLVNMNDPNALDYIVHDVSPVLEGSVFRWAYKRPELRFALTTTTHLSYVMDFALPADNFRQTGPVTISVFINDKLLDAVRYDTPGRKTFRKEVPAAWLRTDSPVFVAAEIDKLYVSPKDGAKLGFVLTRAGFVE